MTSYLRTRPAEMGNIVILGSGRSGTTWIQDCIARANGFSTAFEPLHPEISGIAAKYAYRHLGADENADDLLQYLRRGPSAIREVLWIRYRVPPSRLSLINRDQSMRRSFKAIARGYHQLLKNYSVLRPYNGQAVTVFKFIRANFMVAWIQKHFSRRIIYIVRNPMHVIASQYQRGQSWDPDARMERIKKNASLLANHEDLILKYDARGTTVVEKLAIIWLIENGYAIARCLELGIPVFNYEKLKSGAHTEWKKMGVSLELNHLPDLESRSVPSLMALPIQGYKNLYKAEVEQIHRVLEIYRNKKSAQRLDECYLGLL